jgi:Nuclease-related domain
MKPTTTILIGAPLTGDEARFLHRLHADLQGTESLILANFFAGDRQIDFVVATLTYAAVLELKNFERPVFGGPNGVWTYENASGRRVPYS